MKKKLAVMLGVLTMASMTACTINIGESGQVEIKDTGLTVSGNLDGEIISETTVSEEPEATEETEKTEESQEEKETAPETEEEVETEEEPETEEEIEEDMGEDCGDENTDDTDDGTEDETLEAEDGSTELFPGIPLDDYKNWIYVTSTEMFLESIASDTLLVLAPGVYDITKYFEEEEDSPNTKVKYDAYEGLQITSVNNFAIYAENPLLTTQLVVEDPYADILQFNKCKKITLSGLVMGHAIEEGYCTGAVLGLNSTNDVTLYNMNLYGCGTYGIEAEKCKNITVNDSWIHDCSYGIVYFNSVKNAVFNNCTMSFCKEYTLLDFYKSAAEFNFCLFAYNNGQAMLSETGTYTFNGCIFRGSETEVGIDDMNVTCDDDCVFEENDSSMSVG